jgi:hypothetical protein
MYSRQRGWCIQIVLNYDDCFARHEHRIRMGSYTGCQVSSPHRFLREESRNDFLGRKFADGRTPVRREVALDHRSRHEMDFRCKHVNYLEPVQTDGEEAPYSIFTELSFHSPPRIPLPSTPRWCASSMTHRRRWATFRSRSIGAWLRGMAAPQDSNRTG